MLAEAVHKQAYTYDLRLSGRFEVQNNHLEFNFIQFVIRWPSLRN